jgi:hypothetical protein
MRDAPNRILSSGELTMLANALGEALKATVRVDGTRMDDGALKDLSGKLGKVIMDRFVAGETDPEALKKAAVESVKLTGQ